MEFTLAPGVTACMAEGRVVILDLKRDRYFCLPEKSDAALQRAFLGRHTCDDLPPLYGLARSSILVAGSDGMPLKLSSVRMPSESALDTAAPKPSAARSIGAAIAYVRKRRALRRSGIYGQIARVSAMRPAGHDACTEAEIDAGRALALEFDSISRLVSTGDACLVKSLALIERLRRRSIRADLVLGVRLRPFLAHCWVQNDAFILNDRPEFVRTFSPILVA